MKSFLFSTFFILFTFLMNGQVGVGTTNPSATLDVTAANPTGISTTVDGMLIPRVDRQRAQSMTSLVTSTMIYVNNASTGNFITPANAINITSIGFYFYDGAVWQKLVTGGAGWLTTGNGGLSGTTNFLGTTDAVDVAFRRNNTAAGKIGATSTSFGLGALNAGIATNSTAFGNSALIANTVNDNTAVGNSALLTNTTGNNNTAVGNLALAANSTGTFNTALGSQSLRFNTASNQTAIGYGALFNNTTGTENAVLGYLSMLTNTTGSNNTAVGSQSLYLNNASNQTAVGYGALYSNTTGAGNTGVGRSSLLLNNTGSSNTAVGTFALGANTTAAGNTAVGASALAANTTAPGNTAVGSSALAANTAINNTAVGTAALGSNTTSLNNTAIGYNALITNTNGLGNNTAVGSEALLTNNGGIENTAIGRNALRSSVTTASWNTAVGSNALRFINNAAAQNNVAVGYNAMENSSGNVNQSVAIGSLAARNSLGNNCTSVGFKALGCEGGASTGIDNVAVGNQSLRLNTSGFQNVGIGSYSLELNSSGNNNTAVGHLAGRGNSIGSNNTYVGLQAGSASSGSSNTFVGFQAGNISSGNSVAIGNLAGSADNTSNKLYISNSATTATNSLIYGEFSPARILRTNSTFQIGDPAGTGYVFPAARGTIGQLLQTDGAGVLTWVAPSSVETDPQVSSTTSNAVPKWNGIALVDGIMTDDGTNVIVAGNTRTTNLQMTTGANPNYILQSDASGNGTWVTASSVETDPQVSSTTSNVVPKWNGTALVDGIMTDDGTNVIVAGNTRTTNLQMTTGANPNYILQSDASGNGTWVDPNVKSFVDTGAAIGTYNVSTTEYTVRVFNSLTTINLPSALANPGKIYIIIGSNGIATKNFTASAGGIYDDVTNITYTTLNANQRFMVQSDGANWIVIGN